MDSASHVFDNGVCVTCDPADEHIFDNGVCLSCSDAQPDGPMDENSLALLTAIFELMDGAGHRSWDPGKHPRNPKGAPGGGRFRSMVDRLKDAIQGHLDGKGGAHPFAEFDREQLRRVAKARGIELKRGEDRDSIAEKLLRHLGVAEPAASKPAEKPLRPDHAEVAAAKEHARHVAATVATANRDQVARELERQAEVAPRSLRDLDAVHLPKRDSRKAQEYLASDVQHAFAYYTSMGSSPAVYATAKAGTKRRPQIWLNPLWHGDPGTGDMSANARDAARAGWFAPTDTEVPLASLTAHEFGHHVAEVFIEDLGIDGGADMPGKLALRFLPTLNDALGANRHSPVARNGDLLEPVHAGFKGAMKYIASGQLLEEWVRQNRALVTEKVSEYGASSFHEMLAEIWAEYSTRGENARPHIRVIGDLMREIAEEVRS